jgi:hypothetical protein
VTEYIFLGVFFLLVFGVPTLVWIASNAPNIEFDVSTLWTHQERVDKFAVIILGSWWAHTSAMILETLLRTVETQDWVTYQLWAVPIIAKMFSPTGTPPPPPKE